MKRGIIALAGACILAALVAAAPGWGASGSHVDAGAAAVPKRSILLKNIAFTPRTLRVRRNTKVVFRWRDEFTAHNVRSRGSLRFPGTGSRTKGTHSVTFRRRGTYRYICSLHQPGMSGRIVVR